MTNPKYRYSEIFTSLQGEGEFTGIPTIWLRWFLCNFQCHGFGQEKPEDPETHILPYQEFDVSKVKTIQELPVWNKACDSSYSWSRKYRHLAPEGTASEIADSLEDELRKMRDNDAGKFALQTPHGMKDIHFCMTGGEPMLPRTQMAQVDLLRTLEARENLPRFITIESNGSQPIRDKLAEVISSYVYSGGDWFWSVSPKLLYTSGEQPSRAIRPEVVKTYQDIHNHGQLKFVVSNRKKAWDELEERVANFRDAGVEFPVWIMPVGATAEAQESDDTKEIVRETLRRGYNVSARVHCYIFGNVIGT